MSEPKEEEESPFRRRVGDIDDDGDDDGDDAGDDDDDADDDANDDDEEGSLAQSREAEAHLSCRNLLFGVAFSFSVSMHHGGLLGLGRGSCRRSGRSAPAAAVASGFYNPSIPIRGIPKFTLPFPSFFASSNLTLPTSTLFSISPGNLG